MQSMIHAMEGYESGKENGLKVFVLIRSGGYYAFFRRSRANPFAALSFPLAPTESLSQVLPVLVKAVSCVKLEYLWLCKNPPPPCIERIYAYDL